MLDMVLTFFCYFEDLQILSVDVCSVKLLIVGRFKIKIDLDMFFVQRVIVSKSIGLERVFTRNTADSLCAVFFKTSTCASALELMVILVSLLIPDNPRGTVTSVPLAILNCFRKKPRQEHSLPSLIRTFRPMTPKINRLHELIWISHSDVISKNIENIVQAAVRRVCLFFPTLEHQRKCTIEMSTVCIAMRHRARSHKH